jgi:YVTN family beta-propeller protein
MPIKMDGSAFALAVGLDPPSGRDAMKLRISKLLAIAAFAFAGVLGSAQSLAQNAYITNFGGTSVSVIDTATNAVTATIPVGNGPFAVAVSPDGSKVYVTNTGSNNVSVIDTATNTVIATIPVEASFGVAVSPDGSRVYATTAGTASVSVINAATNAVTATIPVGGAGNANPIGVE